ncbi:Hint domain-containing protein [Roseomonas sp. HJA6]|uniref:Hint domain-containing protein n=1 Tax=Roseomonas alba TaxID=2846776 RepID=A0ABS7AGR9_9PROT|nr:Hint domain-containing protein [Neoroseomonas alba]MBW6401499.1 Hint domain-containing protein [Neoroseomonas alba]
MSMNPGTPTAEAPQPGINGAAGFAAQSATWFETGGMLGQAPCYVAGTRIATAGGEVPVETLKPGDTVVTADGGGPPLRPVIWVGHRKVSLRRRGNLLALAPVRITVGALADGVPHRDLCVSPDHAMFLDGRLVPAGLLVNGVTIFQDFHHAEVTYWHVELPAHALLVAEGALSESYLDDGNRGQYDNCGLITVFMDAVTARGTGRYDAASCFRPLRHGPLLDAIRDRLALRAKGMRRRA